MSDSLLSRKVTVGLCGLGTVGSGTCNVLARNAEDIAARAGCEIVIGHIGARRDNPSAVTGDAVMLSVALPENGWDVDRMRTMVR